MGGHWNDADGDSGSHKMRRGPTLADKGDATNLAGVWCVPCTAETSFVKIEQESDGKVQVALDPSSVVSGFIADNKLQIDTGDGSFQVLLIGSDGTYMEDVDVMQRWYRVAC